jgi:cell division protein FtsW (lipid II flippase)
MNLGRDITHCVQFIILLVIILVLLLHFPLIRLYQYHAGTRGKLLLYLTLIFTVYGSFILNENKSWMPLAKHYLQVKNTFQNILTNLFVLEVYNKNVIFNALLMINVE